MERIIHCKIHADGTPQVRVPLYAGVAGEHNITTLILEGDAGEFYFGEDIARISFCGGDGAIVSTDLLTVETDDSGWRVSYVLPSAMTSLGGQITARLVLSVIEDGEEVQTAISGVVVLFLDDSTMEQGTPFWTAVSQMLHRTVSASDRAATEAGNAATYAETAKQAANIAENAQGIAQAAAKRADEAAGLAAGAQTMRYKGQATTTELFDLTPSAVVGDVYYNTITEAYFMWNGRTWSLIGAQVGEGAAGADGKSAYQIWLELGNSGTEADFIASLKGATGDTGPQGPKGDTYTLTDADKATIVEAVMAAIPDGNGVAY